MEFAIDFLLPSGVTATWCQVLFVNIANVGTVATPAYRYDIRVALYLNQSVRNDPSAEPLKTLTRERENGTFYTLAQITNYIKGQLGG